MKKCPFCGAEVRDNARICVHCGSSFEDDSDRPEPEREKSEAARDSDREKFEAEEEEEFENISEELVESFIGREEIPHGKKTSPQFWMSVLRLLNRLMMPKANQKAFWVGFWVLRITGGLVLASWFYFGLFHGIWDWTKFTAGVVALAFGPAVLRGVEFVFEHLLLRGWTKQRWHDFWNFRRMMTPRSIQFAFFVGFWFLVLSGLGVAVSGFVDLIRSPKVRVHERATSTGIPLLNPETVQEIYRTVREAQHSNGQSDLLQRLSLPVRSQFQKGDTPITTRTLARQGLTTPTARTDAGTESTTSSLSQEDFWKYLRLAEALYNDQIAALTPGARQKNPILRIVFGLASMVFGPLLFRFTCEWIILLFRLNETLTDISWDVDRLLRSLDALQNREPEKDRSDNDESDFS